MCDVCVCVCVHACVCVCTHDVIIIIIHHYTAHVQSDSLFNTDGRLNPSITILGKHHNTITPPLVRLECYYHGDKIPIVWQKISQIEAIIIDYIIMCVGAHVCLCMCVCACASIPKNYNLPC